MIDFFENVCYWRKISHFNNSSDEEICYPSGSILSFSIREESVLLCFGEPANFFSS